MVSATTPRFCFRCFAASVGDFLVELRSYPGTRSRFSLTWARCRQSTPASFFAVLATQFPPLLMPPFFPVSRRQFLRLPNFYSIYLIRNNWLKFQLVPKAGFPPDPRAIHINFLLSLLVGFSLISKGVRLICPILAAFFLILLFSLFACFPVTLEFPFFLINPPVLLRSGRPPLHFRATWCRVFRRPPVLFFVFLFFFQTFFPRVWTPLVLLSCPIFFNIPPANFPTFLVSSPRLGWFWFRGFGSFCALVGGGGDFCLEQFIFSP